MNEKNTTYIYKKKLLKIYFLNKNTKILLLKKLFLIKKILLKIYILIKRNNKKNFYENKN